MPHSNTPFNWNELSFSEVNENLAENQRWSTWDSVERRNHGPKPWPRWLITSAAAIDTELGVLKSGKEADVFLVERAVPDDPDQACLLAAKRYRTADHRLFRRDNAYTAGRRVRNSRDGRAIAGKTDFGRDVEADLWAQAEWSGLKRLFEAGVPVPYPVQLDGREILMEFIADSDAGRRSPHRACTRSALAPTSWPRCSRTFSRRCGRWHDSAWSTATSAPTTLWWTAPTAAVHGW